MDDANKQTIAAYNTHVEEYISGTPQQVDGSLKAWIDVALTYVPQGGIVLELGSAFGRDADYIEAFGYRVQRTDAAASFVELLQRKGHQAKLLNAITDELGGPYDMVFATAVLLHFKPAETATGLQKAYASLKDGGILAFSVMKGTGESWSDAKLNAPRYFCYWQQADLQQVVVQGRFDLVSISEGATKNADWLQVIARKGQQ
jgi:2-polyprenyl-3-methyl-5-hydroxy-6-metoxy-1,4-benzoquinol methylase